jgi:hypothetical protein
VKGSKEFDDQERTEHEIPRHRMSRKNQDGISSDDEKDSHRGHSKLERWTSHKEKISAPSLLSMSTKSLALGIKGFWLSKSTVLAYLSTGFPASEDPPLLSLCP